MKISKRLVIMFILLSGVVLLVGGNVSDVKAKGDYNNYYSLDSESTNSYAKEAINTDLILIIVVVFLIGSILVRLTSKKIAYKKHYTGEPVKYTVPIDNLDKMKKYLPDVNVKELKKDIVDIFVKIQEAMMNFDYVTLRSLCTDELFDSSKVDLEALKDNDQQKIMRDFNVIDTKIVDLNEINGLLTISVFMKVNYFDYVIDTKTKKIIKGSDSVKITNNYYMLFLKSTRHAKITECPNCGEKLEKKDLTICEHCNSKIVVFSDKYILSKMTIQKS